MSESNHSFIHDIRIATPCKANWDEMTGDERARFCAQCKLNVYNISEMTIAEAEELIIGKEGRVCVRLYRRGDGTVITKDCPVGIAAVKRRLATIYGSIAAVASFAMFWVLNLGKPEPQPLGGAVMGAMAPPAIKMGEMAMPESGRAHMGKMAAPYNANQPAEIIMGDYAPGSINRKGK